MPSAFEHGPSITVPSSNTTAKAAAIWSAASTLAESTIILDSGGNGRIGIAGDLDTITITSGTVTVAGTVAATTLTGAGAGITALAAANITASGTLPALNGAALTALNGSNIASGTVAVARLGSGSPGSGNFLRGDGSWQAAAGTTINTNADNRVITGSGTANTLNGESSLTYTGTVLTLNAAGGTPQIQAETTATSGRAVAFQAKIAASSTDNSAGLDFIEGAGNGDAGNMAYHLIYEGKSSGSNLRLNSEDVDGSSTGGTVFQVLDGTKELLVGENNSMPSVTKGIAKAWMKNSGAATPAVEDSYNCTLTDSGTGYRTYTFGDDFENDDYVCVGNAYGPAGNDLQGLIFGQNTLTVGSVDCLVRTSASASNLDLPNAVAFFGEAT